MRKSIPYTHRFITDLLEPILLTNRFTNSNTNNNWNNIYENDDDDDALFSRLWFADDDYDDVENLSKQDIKKEIELFISIINGDKIKSSTEIFWIEQKKSYPICF